MPLIPFPNIPSLPGVPNLPRIPGINTDIPQAVTDILAVTDPRLYMSNEDVDTGWALLNADGTLAIDPDSFVGMDYRDESRICNYPVEQGSFSSYNKVTIPYDVRLIISCGGQLRMSRQEFLDRLKAMKNSTDLFALATPDNVLVDINMTHFDYRRESRSGVSLITAACWFEEVRTTAVAKYSNTNQPSGEDSVSQGQVIATEPTTDQQASFDTEPIQ